MTYFSGFGRTRIFCCGFFLLLGFIFLSQTAFGASTISGTVYDKQRNALVDVEVELLDDFYRVWQNGGRTRTDGSGRYQFAGLPNGSYTVRVFAFRYDLEDQEIPVEINTQNIRGGEGSGYFSQDFYLTPKKGGLRDSELSVVFAQEVPKEAEQAYQKAVEDFAKKRDDEGFANLKKSLEIFPSYYQALLRFGTELYTRKQYKESYQVFIKAIEVNEKSATSFYYLGNSFYNLGKDYYKAAYTSLNKAFTLAPSSVQVLWMLGKVERALGKFPEAETHLLQAKKLSKVGIPEIHKELAQLYDSDLKKYKEAADELELYLKHSRLEGDEEKKIKKIIANLREKAKNQTAKS